MTYTSTALLWSMLLIVGGPTKENLEPIDFLIKRQICTDVKTRKKGRVAVQGKRVETSDVFTKQLPKTVSVTRFSAEFRGRAAAGALEIGAQSVSLRPHFLDVECGWQCVRGNSQSKGPGADGMHGMVRATSFAPMESSVQREFELLLLQPQLLPPADRRSAAVQAARGAGFGPRVRRRAAHRNLDPGDFETFLCRRRLRNRLPLPEPRH
eukprot:SAG11_NODE_2703_length_3074_cov_3.917983_3_plen_210_part_00